MMRLRIEKYPNRSAVADLTSSSTCKCSCNSPALDPHKKQQGLRPPHHTTMVLTQRHRSQDDTILPSASDDYDPKGP